MRRRRSLQTIASAKLCRKRRVICDLPSNALYKMFLSLCGDAKRLDSGEYTIEHICPQKLPPAWSAELGGLAKHFARTEDAFGAAEGIDQEIYLNTGLSTQRKISTLLKLFDHYGEDPGDLIFFLEDAPEPDSGDGSGAPPGRSSLPALSARNGTRLGIAPRRVPPSARDQCESDIYSTRAAFMVALVVFYFISKHHQK